MPLFISNANVSARIEALLRRAMSAHGIKSVSVEQDGGSSSRRNAAEVRMIGALSALEVFAGLNACQLRALLYYYGGSRGWCPVTIRSATGHEVPIGRRSRRVSTGELAGVLGVSYSQARKTINAVRTHVRRQMEREG